MIETGGEGYSRFAGSWTSVAIERESRGVRHCWIVINDC